MVDPKNVNKLPLQTCPCFSDSTVLSLAIVEAKPFFLAVLWHYVVNMFRTGFEFKLLRKNALIFHALARHCID